MRRHSSAGLALFIVWTVVAFTGAPVPAQTPADNPNVGCHIRGALPDPQCTPGAVATTDKATICRQGYASDERSVTTAEKNAVYAEYGITDHTGMVIDHLIGLEEGGSNDIHNLWPQRTGGWPGSHDKDLIEGALHRAICDGRVAPADAQRWLATDWRTALVEPTVQG